MVFFELHKTLSAGTYLVVEGVKKKENKRGRLSHCTPNIHIPLATIILMIHSQEPVIHSAITETFKYPVDKPYTISKHHNQRWNKGANKVDTKGATVCRLIS